MGSWVERGQSGKDEPRGTSLFHIYHTPDRGAFVYLVTLQLAWQLEREYAGRPPGKQLCFSRGIATHKAASLPGRDEPRLSLWRTWLGRTASKGGAVGLFRQRGLPSIQSPKLPRASWRKARCGSSDKERAIHYAANHSKMSLFQKEKTEEGFSVVSTLAN